MQPPKDLDRWFPKAKPVINSLATRGATTITVG